MEASSSLSEDESVIPQIKVWQVYEDNELSHHLIIDGQDKGAIDWEFTNGGERMYATGLDAEAELEEQRLKSLAWPLIAGCMRELYPAVKEVTSLDGLTFH